MRVRFLISLVLCSAPFLGCAGSNYYDTYTRENPGSYVTLPDVGAGLHETLAGLYAPHHFDYRLTNGKLSVVRLTEEAAVELSPEQISRALAAPPVDTHYGIVSVVDCRSRVDKAMYYGQRVQWMLLEHGRLSAWDLSLFVNKCVVGSDFRPASAERAALEDQLRAFRDRTFPRSMSHAAHIYAQGLAYLQAGRFDAAVESLARGDENFDPDEPRVVQFEQPSDRVHINDRSDTAMVRSELVRAINAIRNARAAGDI